MKLANMDGNAVATIKACCLTCLHFAYHVSNKFSIKLRSTYTVNQPVEVSVLWS